MTPWRRAPLCMSSDSEGYVIRGNSVWETIIVSDHRDIK